MENKLYCIFVESENLTIIGGKVQLKELNLGLPVNTFTDDYFKSIRARATVINAGVLDHWEDVDFFAKSYFELKRVTKFIDKLKDSAYASAELVITEEAAEAIQTTYNAWETINV